MHLAREVTHRFDPVIDHVKQTLLDTRGSGAAAMVIHENKIVTEMYTGRHSLSDSSRPIQADSQFHVASVRKCYIGFAVAYAVYHGYITSIDEPVSSYLPAAAQSSEVSRAVTIRHLLTHTHGLKMDGGQVARDFWPGESWSYRGLGVDMLCDIVTRTTGKWVAEILQELVLNPLDFTHSNWYAKCHESLVDVVREANHPLWAAFDSVRGDKSNMYVSTQELAYWGYLHLKRGQVLGRQVVPRELIDLATSLQSPALRDSDLPQNGFLWFVKDHPAKRNEIGDSAPTGSYQILGYTGVTLLVIPKHETVAVRMFNSWGSPPGYDYLADVRAFGDCVMRCLE